MKHLHTALEALAILILIGCMFIIVKTARADSLYAKVGVGYIVSQPDKITYKNWSQPLQYSPWSAYIESGAQLGQWATGVHYAKGSGDRHDPSKLELFVDYDWAGRVDWRVVTGIGYKLMYQDYVVLPTGQKDTYNPGSSSDDFSARIGLSRAFGSYELGLWHHSQWFTGIPINRTWEYHKTEFTISRVF